MLRSRSLQCIFYMYEAESVKPSSQMWWWCVIVGVVFDYVAVQSKAAMLLSHLDRITSGGNTCSCVCRVQSRDGNLDLIKKMAEETEQWMFVASVWLHLWCVKGLLSPVLVCADAYLFVCSPTICLWVCEQWQFYVTNWQCMIAKHHVSILSALLWRWQLLPFLSHSCKVQVHATKKYWPFCPNAIRIDNQGIKWIRSWQGHLERVRDEYVRRTVMKSMARV